MMADRAPALSKTPKEWRALANVSARAKDDSFDRCDTDGFLSQWAHGLSAQLFEAKARVSEANGMMDFPGLFLSVTGERMKAKLLNRPTYGRPWVSESVWRVEMANGAVVWIPAFKKGRASKMFKNGMEERMEAAPADAKIMSKGRGTGGQAWVAIYRTDGGSPGAKADV